jgi:dihydroneopterin triphosphate diphosphatase
MRQATSVLIYPVVKLANERQFLLLHRVPRPDLGLPAFWQGISGGLENNESVEATAKREFIEETGITPLRIEAIGFSCLIPIMAEWRDKYPSGTEHITEHVFLAHLDGQQKPKLSREHDQFKWCSENEAIDLLSFANNIEALKRSLDYMKSHNN